MNEFDIIQQFFKRPFHVAHDAGIIHGIGDDGAVVRPHDKMDLVVTADMLLADVHFPKSAHPYDIAQKSLRVNLSDIAAMGASPKWFTLSLALEQNDQEWLKAFSTGLHDVATQYNIHLIGGDLTKGPMCVSIQATGELPQGMALTRGNVQIGDHVFVTGTLGNAAAALSCLGQNDVLTQSYYRPTPRLEIGQRLRGIANGAIDISDGFLADLGHLLAPNQLGAEVNLWQLPLSAAITEQCKPEDVLRYALTGGDDYELCFTIPPSKLDGLKELTQTVSCPITHVGKVCHDASVRLLNQDGTLYQLPEKQKGFTHF